MSEIKNLLDLKYYRLTTKELNLDHETLTYNFVQESLIPFLTEHTEITTLSICNCDIDDATIELTKTLPKSIQSDLFNKSELQAHC